MAIELSLFLTVLPNGDFKVSNNAPGIVAKVPGALTYRVPRTITVEQILEWQKAGCPVNFVFKLV